MRVLIAHPGAEMYGADRVMLESARGLREAGHDVVVALPETGALATALVDAGARVIVVPMFVLRKELLSPRNWLELFRSAARGLGATWRLIGRVRPDVGYVNTVILPQWPLLLRLRRVPAVAHVHEAESSASWWLRAVLYLPLLPARAVIANSRFTATVMRGTIPSLHARTSVILNPLSGPPAAEPPREKLQDIQVAFVGRLSPRKGPDLVIEAVSLLRDRGRDLRLHIVGDVFRGYEWFSDELDRRVEELDLSGVVERHGYEPDVWPRFAAADVLVVPSRVDESFGNTAVEAVLASRPVIVSDLRGLREAVDGYASARIVPIGDSAAIAREIDDLIEGWQNVVKDVGSAALTAAERHSPRQYRHAVAETLEHVVAAFSGKHR